MAAGTGPCAAAGIAHWLPSTTYDGCVGATLRNMLTPAAPGVGAARGGTVRVAAALLGGQAPTPGCASLLVLAREGGAIGGAPGIALGFDGAAAFTLL